MKLINTLLLTGTGLFWWTSSVIAGEIDLQPGSSVTVREAPTRVTCSGTVAPAYFCNCEDLDQNGSDVWNLDLVLRELPSWRQVANLYYPKGGMKCLEAKGLYRLCQ